MDTFKEFSDISKNDFVFITIGIIMIAFVTFSTKMIGNFSSNGLKLIGVFILTYGSVLFIYHNVSFFRNNPLFLTNEKYIPFRNNMYAGCGMSVLLTVLILYTTYTVFF